MYNDSNNAERVANLSLMCCVCCPWGRVGATVVIAVGIVVAVAQVEARMREEGVGAGLTEAWESDSCRQSRRITNEKFLMMLHEVA